MRQAVIANLVSPVYAVRRLQEKEGFPYPILRVRVWPAMVAATEAVQGQDAMRESPVSANRRVGVVRMIREVKKE